jgi:FkbM family methyltransferase
VILDLGANIGITVADNARRYPGARLIAVELDPENAELARLNTAPWADRVELLQGAVWTEDGEIASSASAATSSAFAWCPTAPRARPRPPARSRWTPSFSHVP